MEREPLQSDAGPSEQKSISTTMLARLRAGDSDAWNSLAALFSPVVYQWCRQARLKPHDTLDIVQEVFRSVFGKVDDFRREKPDDTFRGWLWTITRHKICDHFRRQAREAEAIGGTDAKQQLQQLEESTYSEMEASSELNSERVVARRAMDLVRGDFDERTWQAFWRMSVDGHSSAEIAADLGMNKEAVRRAKYRVLQRLRQELDGLL
ncbi:MAG: sigma-70 family RNA polymerase sigma factor [Planctomycetes bacterium]|nr:sigma-70 family RNA polymerase sigma factor [Planctomycetota bacterium]